MWLLGNERFNFYQSRGNKKNYKIVHIEFTLFNKNRPSSQKDDDRFYQTINIIQKRN